MKTLKNLLNLSEEIPLIKIPYYIITKEEEDSVTLAKHFLQDSNVPLRQLKKGKLVLQSPEDGEKVYEIISISYKNLKAKIKDPGYKIEYNDIYKKFIEQNPNSLDDPKDSKIYLKK